MADEAVPRTSGSGRADNSIVRETYKQRLLLIGPTLPGRLLTVVAGPVSNQPDVYYVFSARPASREERQYFQHQEGGSDP